MPVGTQYSKFKGILTTDKDVYDYDDIITIRYTTSVNMDADLKLFANRIDLNIHAIEPTHPRCREWVFMAGILRGCGPLSNDVTIVVDGKTTKVQVRHNITGELSRIVDDMRKHGMKEWATMMHNMKNAVPEGWPYHSGFLYGYRVGREIERKKLD